MIERFKIPENPDPNEMDIFTARGWVINELNEREEQMSKLLLNYFSPKNPNDFKGYILNSTVISFAAKRKLLIGLGIIDTGGILQKSLGDIGRIRNGFAHTTLDTIYNIPLEIGKPQMFNTSTWKNVTQEMRVMNSNGEIKIKSPRTYFKEFIEYNKTAKKELTALI